MTTSTPLQGSEAPGWEEPQKGVTSSVKTGASCRVHLELAGNSSAHSVCGRGDQAEAQLLADEALARELQEEVVP